MANLLPYTARLSPVLRWLWLGIYFVCGGLLIYHLLTDWEEIGAGQSALESAALVWCILGFLQALSRSTEFTETAIIVRRLPGWRLERPYSDVQGISQRVNGLCIHFGRYRKLILYKKEFDEERVMQILRDRCPRLAERK